MRLDARKGDTDWRVWDVPACRARRDLIWVDDESAQVGCLPHPVQIVNGEAVLRTEQRSRIVIYPASKFVILDPLDDAEPAALEVVAVAKAGRP